MLRSSMDSRALGTEIKELISTSLLPYSNSFRSYMDSNTMSCWHSEFNCFHYYLLSLERGPNPCMSPSSSPLSEDFDVSSSPSPALTYESLHSAVHLVLFTHVLFFHSFYMSAGSSLLFLCHSSKTLLCHLLNIVELKCIIYCSYSDLHNTLFFMGFKWRW